jgi:DNA-directed RNA polymerase specialized sigma24 family protein
MSQERRAGEWSDRADEESVVAALLGNRPAFDELVRRFRPAVHLTARRYSSSEEAVGDLCQEAFVRAFKTLGCRSLWLTSQEPSGLPWTPMRLRASR